MGSFVFAFRGLRFLFVNEHNARLHLLATMVVLLTGAILGVTANEWLWIVVAVGSVWFAEAINTAIEQLANAVTTDHDPRIGAAKDVAAAAVLICSLVALIIGLVIFVPRLM